MPTLDQLTAAPREVTLAGEPFVVAPLTMREWGKFQAWIKDKGPSPLRACTSEKLANLEDDHRREMMRLALMEELRWPPPVFSQMWIAVLLGSPEADGPFVHAILSKCRPDFTPEQAAALAERMSVDEFRALIHLAKGEDPPLPKSPAPASTAPPAGADATPPPPDDDDDATTPPSGG